MQRNHGKEVTDQFWKWFPAASRYHQIVLMLNYHHFLHILLLKGGVLSGSRTGVGAGGPSASPVDARTRHPPVEILLAITPPLDDSPAPAVGHVTEHQERLSLCPGLDPVVATCGALPAVHGRAIWAERDQFGKWGGGKARGCVPPREEVRRGCLGQGHLASLGIALQAL